MAKYFAQQNDEVEKVICSAIFLVLYNLIFVDKNASKDPNIPPKIPEPRIPYPKISALSIEDQQFFLDIYKEYISGKEIGSENLNRLQVL